MWEADTEAGLCECHHQSVKILLRAAIGALEESQNIQAATSFLRGAESSLTAAMKRLEGVELALAAMKKEQR